MIKTKVPFIIFSILLLLLFPFSVLFIKSDSVSSMIPGWNSTINSFWILATIIKFITLSIVVLMYWKLSKVGKKIGVKFFVLHLMFTIPSILNSKIPFQSFIEFDNNNIQKTISEIETVNLIVIASNIVFIIGQVIFGFYYFKRINTSANRR
jgi:hypothetical protein